MSTSWLRVPLGSREYIKVPFTTAPDNADGYTVEMSIIPYGQKHATESDWRPAEWVTNGDGLLAARLLIGPGEGALDLGAGTYIVRARITANPERPIVESGLLEVY